jgi:hypothetical protein
MKATLLYRIASVLLVLFALGHTVGFLRFKPPSPEGLAVRDAMNHTHFQLKTGTYSYGDFYIGFGLTATAYLLFSAFLAWHLGKLAKTSPQAIGTLGWVFCMAQVVGMVLSWIYFAPPPVVFFALTALCLGWAARLTQTRTQSAHA